MKLKRAALWVFKGVAALIAVVVAAFLLFAWLGHPKFSTDNIFIRPAGKDVFKMSDIPRGRALTPPEIDQYAGKLLAEMTLREKVDQMSGDTGLWELAKLVTVERLKYNDSPILAGRNPRLEIPPVAFSDGARGVGRPPTPCFPGSPAGGGTRGLG